MDGVDESGADTFGADETGADTYATTDGPHRSRCDRWGSASLDLNGGIWGSRAAGYLPSTWC